MYPEQLTKPMRAELTSLGFEDITSPEQVEAIMKREGVSLLVINSVCGCAAGSARPAVKLALQSSEFKPDHIATVFAGVDQAATQRAREFLLPYPPSSPSIALLKDGEVVHFIERHHIEGRTATMIADNLVDALEEYCVAK